MLKKCRLLFNLLFKRRHLRSQDEHAIMRGVALRDCRRTPSALYNSKATFSDVFVIVFPHHKGFAASVRTVDKVVRALGFVSLEEFHAICEAAAELSVFTVNF